jgi:hypothetical protein
MLPDFVRVKNRRGRLFLNMVRRECERLTPLLNHIRTVQQHEGLRLDYETVEGIREVVAYDNEISSSLKVKLGELAQLGPKEYRAKARGMARELARQTMGQFFAQVARSCDEAGTSMDAGGRPFDPMMLLDGFEKIDIDFDERGQPQLPTLVGNPKQQPIFAKKMAEAENSPEFQRRWSEIMTQKWVEWRDREADRKLVE